MANGFGGYGFGYGGFGGYGGYGGCGYGYGYGNETAQFLSTLSPGVRVSLQYDCQPPAFGIFQGFQGGNVILSNYNGFPGLVRIAASRVNAVSPFC
ncbi:MAG: hypothetical protein ACM3ZQ_05600 [Bacillota bacterium]